MSSIPVRYQQSMHPRQSRSRRFFQLGSMSSRFIGFALLALLAMIYIAQTGQAATKRVEVYSLKSQADMLQDEQNQLQLEATRLKSLYYLNQSVDSLQLAPVDTVEQPKK